MYKSEGDIRSFHVISENTELRMHARMFTMKTSSILSKLISNENKAKSFVSFMANTEFCRRRFYDVTKSPTDPSIECVSV